MKKLLLIGAVIIVTAVAFFALTGESDSPAPESNTTQSETSDSTDTNIDETPEHLQTANIKETVDAQDQKEISVTIDDFFFSPTILTISKGTTVTWTNEGDVAHTVTSTEDSPKKGLDSELMQSGDTYSFTFDEAGVYNYLCTPHPSNMRAIIKVIE